jgi:hypothetical protein
MTCAATELDESSGAIPVIFKTLLIFWPRRFTNERSLLPTWDRLDRSMIFAIISMIYAGTILFFVGTTALILLAWARRRYADRSPNDLIYVAPSSEMKSRRLMCGWPPPGKR